MYILYGIRLHLQQYRTNKKCVALYYLHIFYQLLIAVINKNVLTPICFLIVKPICRPRCPNGLPLEVTHLGTDRGIALKESSIKVKECRKIFPLCWTVTKSRQRVRRETETTTETSFAVAAAMNVDKIHL